MIVTKQLTKIYHIDSEEIKAVNGVNLSVSKGEFVSIIGHSGSGKTTLLSLLGGLTRPTSGTVIIDGIDLWSISDDKLSEFRNEKINFIYQFASLIPTLTAMENVLLPTIFGKRKKENKQKKAIELLELVGLKEKINAYPSQLSGGQQRRVAIARAFINDPEIILADEPTGDLDEETEREIINLFNRMNKEKGITFIMVTHNSEIANFAQRRLRMKNGLLIEEEN